MELIETGVGGGDDMDKDMEVRGALWEKQAGMEVQLEAWQGSDHGKSYIL